MNYQKKIYDTVKSYIESISALDEKEREINKQVQMETLARVTAEQQREELKAQRSADAATRKAEFDDYAARAANVCREPQSIRAGLFLENNGVAESVSYEY